ncbi:MAG: enoyl-CoA hydratase/isomerase family protein [Vicinamibacterales bacterium]
MPTSHVLFEIDGHTAFLTVNRPDARNAMTWDMYDALVRACEQVDAHEDLRVFVVRAAGDTAFVAGTDISQFTSVETQEAAIAYERRLDAVIDRLERVRVPTIARVQGVAAGGGCAIAFACDLRVCSPEAKFGVPIARTLGNCLSASNYARIMDLIGPARTKEILFTGRLIDAAEAATLGLVTRLAPLEELDSTVRSLADTIAANAPLTIRATKEAVRRIQEHRRLESSLADDLVAQCYTSADFKEGVAAFLARRPPHFTGQ